MEPYCFGQPLVFYRALLIYQVLLFFYSSGHRRGKAIFFTGMVHQEDLSPKGAVYGKFKKLFARKSKTENRLPVR